jgi:hypothetical protein
MSNEIPDSDAESDYEVGPDPQAADPPFVEQTLLKVGDRGLDINFDDFISQPQSAKDGSSQLGLTKRSTASTQKHLRDALENQRGSASSSYDKAGDVDQSAGYPQLPTSGVGPRKRAYSEIGGRHDHKAPSQSRTKSTKTYIASPRRVTPTQDIDEPLEPTNIELAEFANPFAATSPPQGNQDEEDIVPQAKNRLTRAVSLLCDSVSNAGHVLSMTNSSMGGYQSYNLDFRGPGSALDIDANPFGALSQVSVDASIEHTAEGTRTDFLSTVPPSASPRPPGRDAISPLTDAGFGPQPTAEITTSTDPSVLLFQPPEDLQMLISPATTIAAQKSASTFTNTSAYDIGESQTEVQTTPNHTEGTTSSKACDQTSKAWRQASLAPTEGMTTDQQGDEEMEENEDDAIGLPKERYKPRPSKSRGSTTEPERQSQPDEDELLAKKKSSKKCVKAVPKATEHSSPVKLPTSELNLSDEAIIGLPKENYKPRPSRRRSRMIAEDDEATIEVDTGSVYSKDPEQPMQSQQSKHSVASHTLEVAEPATPKPKKGKKAKVKRAKTSATCLLKKSEPMVSDGEDDVLWMETRPAKLKLDISAATLAREAVKEETTAEKMVTVEASVSGKTVESSQEQSKPPASARSKMVTVEIPARAEKDKTEPKRRGRKAKAVAINEENDTEPETNMHTTSIPATDPPASSPPPCAITSTILKEKDTNKSLPPPPMPKKPSDSSSPTKAAKIIHSPINPSGGKVLYRVGLSRRSAIPPLLKIVKPPAKQQVEKENLDEDGQPRDLVAETMKKWREMGVLD